MERIITESIDDFPYISGRNVFLSRKFQVRMEKCHRTNRSSGCCGTGVSYRTHRSSGYGTERLYPYPRYCATILQKSQKFRVRVQGSYRTYRSSGYRYECLTELTEVPGTGMKVLQNSQKFRAGMIHAVPVPRVLCHRLTELTEVPGTGMNVIQNLQKFRVRV